MGWRYISPGRNPAIVQPFGGAGSGFRSNATAVADLLKTDHVAHQLIVKFKPEVIKYLRKIDIGDLRGRKSNHFVTMVVFKIYVKVMEIAPGGS